jgi:isocitrate dehydrogenase (NAD+)
MLRHLGETDTADRVYNALARVYQAKRHITRDLGGTASTGEFADAVIEQLQSAPANERETAPATRA